MLLFAPQTPLLFMGQEHGEPAPHAVFVPLKIRGPQDQELRFLSTRTTFATAVDVTVSELAIESFFPADAPTAAAIRAYAPASR